MKTIGKSIISILIIIFIIALSGCPVNGPSEEESDAKDITAFSIGGATGVITGTNVALTVPYGTDITSLIATFAISGGTVVVGATPQTSGTTVNDFTNSVFYSVTAEDGSIQTYTVTITVAINDAKEITAFSVGGAAGIITGTDITVTVLIGKDVTSLSAVFTISGETIVIGTTSQISGTTVNDFTNPLTYTVTALDGSTQDYTVIVAFEPGTDYTVTSPVFPATGILDGGFVGNFRIINNGTINGTAAVNWTVYRSDDAFFDDGDFEFFSGIQAFLNAGIESSPIPFSGLWPSTEGTYYLIIVLSASDEGDTSNDTLSSSAIPVIDSGRFVLAGENGLLMYSDDAGITWTSAAGVSTSSELRDLATNGLGLWVVVGDEMKLYYSTDNGESWLAGSITGTSYSNDLTGVAYDGNGNWVASGIYIGETTTLYSSDGINWSLKAIGGSPRLESVAYDSANARWISPDVSMTNWYHSDTYNGSWSYHSGMAGGPYSSVTFGGDRVVGVGGNTGGTDDNLGFITSGTSWVESTTNPTSGSDSYFESAYDGSLVWVVVGSIAAYSTDSAVNWTSAADIGTGLLMLSVTYDSKSERFVAGCADGNIKYSDDGGNNWTDITTGTGMDIWAIDVGP
jgi:hypothetical protein